MVLKERDHDRDLLTNTKAHLGDCGDRVGRRDVREDDDHTARSEGGGDQRVKVHLDGNYQYQ